MMTVFLFFVVLGVLVLVHELGHFWAAKLSGVKVEEFGIGIPPKAYGFTPKNSEVEYSINWLPIGGFVRIFGENYDDNDIVSPDFGRSFVNAKKYKQIFIIIAGVLMNFIAAIVLLSAAAWLGNLVPVESPEQADGFYVASVSPGSPADEAGLPAGVEILAISDGEQSIPATDLTNERFAELITESEQSVIIQYMQDDESGGVVTVEPETGLILDEPDRQAIGVYADNFVFQRAGFFEGIASGWNQSVNGIVMITSSFADLITDSFSGNGSETFKSLAGPVGIAQLSAQAYEVGIGSLFTFAAILSLNLVVLNMLPVPALDGGRIVFVIIETLRGKPLNPKYAGMANAIGFGLLLLLMLAITVQDIVRVF